MCKILKCPECEDRDCNFNAEGKCFDIATIKEEVPDGMYTCNGAKKDFIL